MQNILRGSEHITFTSPLTDSTNDQLMIFILFYPGIGLWYWETICMKCRITKTRLFKYIEILPP